MAQALLLIGAGLTGSFILSNSRVSDFFADLSKALSKQLKEEDASGKVSDKTADIIAQLSRLRQELKDIQTSRPVTIINGSTRESGGMLIAAPVVIVGAGYAYLWWKGWSLKDFMYVTNRSMKTAVTSLSSHLEQVSAALSATKRQLSGRLETVSKTLDDNVITTTLIKDQVVEARADIGRVGGDVQDVQELVAGLAVRVEEVCSKQDLTIRGVQYLCEVAQGWKTQKPELVEGISYLSKLALEPPELASSSTSRPSSPLKPQLSAGLKGLQDFPSEPTSPNPPMNADRPPAERALRPTFSLDFMRSLSLARR